MVGDLVQYLAQKVVDDPASVRVEHVADQGSYLIHVASGEEGRVIGRGGRVIQAIRTIARAAAGPRERVNVDVVSPNGSEIDTGISEDEPDEA